MIMLNEEKIVELEKKYGVGKVKQLEVTYDGKTYTGFLKRPSRNELRPVLAMFKKDEMRATEILLETCWVDGDLEIKNDDDIFLSAMLAVQDIIKIGSAELKN